jgi:hypothetical protein
MILQILSYRGERVAIERAINGEVDAPTNPHPGTS